MYSLHILQFARGFDMIWRVQRRNVHYVHLIWGLRNRENEWKLLDTASTVSTATSFSSSFPRRPRRKETCLIILTDIISIPSRYDFQYFFNQSLDGWLDSEFFFRGVNSRHNNTFLRNGLRFSHFCFSADDVFFIWFIVDAKEIDIDFSWEKCSDKKKGKRKQRKRFRLNGESDSRFKSVI